MWLTRVACPGYYFTGFFSCHDTEISHRFHHYYFVLYMLRHLTAAGSRNRWLRDCRFVGSPRPDAVASSHPQALDVHCDAVGSMGRSAVMLQTETGDVQKVQHIGEKDKAIPVQLTPETPEGEKDASHEGHAETGRQQKGVHSFEKSLLIAGSIVTLLSILAVIAYAFTRN
eukprot:g2938.t1